MGEMGSRRMWEDWDRRDRESLGVLSGQVCSGDLGRLRLGLSVRYWNERLEERAQESDICVLSLALPLRSC